MISKVMIRVKVVMMTRSVWRRRVGSRSRSQCRKSRILVVPGLQRSGRTWVDRGAKEKKNEENLGSDYRRSQKDNPTPPARYATQTNAMKH